MSAVNRLPALLVLSAVLGTCGQGPAEQNIMITNEVPANVDVEVLPPDESAGTPTDELRNGAADPEVDENVADGG